MPVLRIDTWSDVACPWCYVGKRRMEAALARFEHAADVQIVWRSFELDASAPRTVEGDYVERLGKKYRASREQAQAMIDRMIATAAGDGLTMRFDQIRPGNTFEAHKLLHAAAERGLDGALKERLLAAYFCEGAAIGDPDTLVRLAGEVGLEESAARAALAEPALAEAVRADQALARELQITGVPFFVLAEQIGIPGAQPVELLLQELRSAWKLVAGDASAAVAEVGEGATCGPVGCS